LIGAIGLSGCTTGSLQYIPPSQISGTAAGLLGIPSATAAAQTSADISQISAVAAQLQMLKAQLDGTPLPVLPPITPTSPPVLLPTPSPTPPPTTTPPGTLPTAPTSNG
jgi:hypothetical protein